MRVPELVLLTGAGVVAGLLCAVVPWWIPIGLLIVLAFVMVTARHPFVGLVLTIMLAFEAIPARFAPDLPLGFFKAKPHELIFLWTILVYVVRTWFSQNNEKFEMPAFAIPYVFMLSWVLIGVVYGVFYQGNGSFVITEARGFLGLLAMPLVQLVVRDQKGIDRLSIWITVAAIILSIYVVAQAMTGVAILASRVEALDTRGNTDITRSVVGTGAMIQGFALFYMTLSLKSGHQWRLWLVPLVVIVLLGLLGTYTRGAWISAVLGGLVAAFLAARWRGVFTALVLGSVMVGLTVATAYVLKPRVAEAAIERVLGINKELNEGGSFGWRKRENQRALEVIEQRPLLGVGVGGIYKNTMSNAGHFEAEYVFIHNGYLYFPLKMGVLAGLGPFLILGAFALMLLRMFRNMGAQTTKTIASCAGTVAMLYVSAIEAPVFMIFSGLLILGVTLSLTATSYRLMRASSASSSNRPAHGANLRPPFANFPPGTRA